MGRRRIYMHHSVPGTVVSIVQTMIQDYPRRKRFVECSLSDDTEAKGECLRLNRAIDDIVNSYEPTLSGIIVSDIINCRGYDRSEAAMIASKNLYYNLKHKLIEDIALKFNLI